MRIFCIGHKAPEFSINAPYTHVSSTTFSGLVQLVIPDDSLGERFHGNCLSEYTQLMGLAETLINSPREERIYICQYRKFLAFRQGCQQSNNVTYAYSSSKVEAESLFPSQDELSALDRSFLLGPIVKTRSLAHHYATHHMIEDFVAFCISLNSIEYFTEERCKNFINCKFLIPSPSLGVCSIDVFLKHMKILKEVFNHFSSNFLVSRSGYQRRVGGFLLERLHSFLLYEEIYIKKTINARHGFQIVISNSPIIRPTI